MGIFHSKSKSKWKEETLFNQSETIKHLSNQYLQSVFDTFNCCGKSEPRFDDFTKSVFCLNCSKRQKIDLSNLNFNGNK